MKVQEKTQGNILRLLNYGEADLIITFLSGRLGKLKGIAKGARKSRKRFANTLEIFSLSEIIFSRRESTGLAIIEDSQIIDHYGRIRDDLEKTLIASYMTELVDHFTPEGKSNPDIYELFNSYLHLLDNHPLNRAITHFFELKLLKVAGFEPVLDRCVSCRRPLEAETSFFFLAQEGGIKCRTCSPSLKGLAVSPGTLKTLLHSKSLPTERINSLSFSPEARQQAKELLFQLIEHILGKKVKSYLILNETSPYFK